MTEPKADVAYAAKRAYIAYGNEVQWQAVSGLRMPKWEELTDKIQQAWMTATASVLAYASQLDGIRSRKPYLTAMVHYASRGSMDGQYPSTCRAAVITQVFTKTTLGNYAINHEQASTVGLHVMSPEGVYHLTLEGSGGCKYVLPPDRSRVPGTWHWAEDCTAP